MAFLRNVRKWLSYPRVLHEDLEDWITQSLGNVQTIEDTEDILKTCPKWHNLKIKDRAQLKILRAFKHTTAAPFTQIYVLQVLSLNGWVWSDTKAAIDSMISERFKALHKGGIVDTRKPEGKT